MKKYLSILLICLLALTVFGAAAEETAPVEIKVLCPKATPFPAIGTAKFSMPA